MSNRIIAADLTKEVFEVGVASQGGRILQRHR